MMADMDTRVSTLHEHIVTSNSKRKQGQVGVAEEGVAEEGVAEEGVAEEGVALEKVSWITHTVEPIGHIRHQTAFVELYRLCPYFLRNRHIHCPYYLRNRHIHCPYYLRNRLRPLSLLFKE